MAHVGDRIESELANWSFAGVSEQFDAHISRSVPLYHEGHRLILAMTDSFLPPGSTCYDLGCSTGTLLGLLAERNRGKDVRFVGIDTDPGMVDKARETCASYPSVTILESDLLDAPLDKADVVIAYYTMQFVRPRDRQAAFDRIYEALNRGGAFCCFEKVRAPDARFQDILTGVYTDFKLDRGFTPDEIVHKERSLKGVLEPFSTKRNLELLERSGFVDVITIFKYSCFEGFLAIK